MNTASQTSLPAPKNLNNQTSNLATNTLTSQMSSLALENPTSTFFMNELDFSKIVHLPYGESIIDDRETKNSQNIDKCVTKEDCQDVYEHNEKEVKQKQMQYLPEDIKKLNAEKEHQYDEGFKSKGFPVIKSFYDVIKNKDALIKAVEANLDDDVIYRLDGNGSNDFYYNIKENMFLKTEFPRAKVNLDVNYCIAGSRAISNVISQINEAHTNLFNAQSNNIKSKLKKMYPDTSMDVCFVELKKTDLKIYGSEFHDEAKFMNKTAQSDTDIFFLNSKRNLRTNLGTVDLVHSTDTCVEELLLNFDLPCCRAAFNNINEYWVSSQCLYALFTGTYPLPSYVFNVNDFVNILLNYRKDDHSKYDEVFLQDRYVKRMQKYALRGFSPIKYDTKTILPWIINRNHYGVWFV